MTEHGTRITKDNLQWIYPLLPAQEGMLFHGLADADSDAYFQQLCFRIAGRFDPERCEGAWNALLARHELLRSAVIFREAPRPLQVVAKARRVEFVYEDLSELETAAREARLLDRMRADRRRGFDTETDCLVRVQVYRLGEAEFEMVWCFPHLLLDGWSGLILHREFLTIYGELRTGRPASDRSAALGPAPPYGRFLDWLERRDKEAAREYWREYLAGYEGAAPLRELAESAEPNDYLPAEHVFLIDAAETSALSRWAASRKVTVATVTHAVWAVLLGRYSGSDDVMFGNVTAGRPAEVEGMDRMIGMFLRTTPVRVRLGRHGSFSELVGELQRAALESAEYDFYPLVEIQAVAGRGALFDHVLAFENYSSDREPLRADPGADFVVSSYKVVERVNYDFGLLITPGADGIEVKFAYNRAAYDPRFVNSVEGHFRKVVAGVLSDADPAALDVLARDEREAVLGFGRGPVAPRRDRATLADLWELRVAESPGAIALHHGDVAWSYAELDARANGIAEHLLEHCRVRPEDPVGVFLGREPSWIASLLGVLKAGGAYVPIDPRYPEERIRLITGDSACRAILTRGELSAKLPTRYSGEVVAVDRLEPRTARAGADRRDGRHVAYVIYTSGSTGRPKGVLVEHEGFINMIDEQIKIFSINPGDRILQFASASFDASLSEIFMALLAGAGLILVPEPTLADPSGLREAMDRYGATVVTLPPSYLAALDRVDFPGLRVVIMAGEAAGAPLVRRLVRSVRCFNAYGPTESSVCATIQAIDESTDLSNGVPIGVPLANTGLFVVDRWLRPTPIRTPGEIVITGTGLARGYLNRPEETRSRFIPNPLGEGRCYRTGDRGRLRFDGSIEFLGRLDDQVKVRGHRIEPGEIERCLALYPGVGQVGVVVEESDGGAKELVAYYTQLHPLEPDELKAHLAAALPQYMLPARLVRLSTLPLTPNGKLDRKGLLPRRDEGSGARSRVPPRTEAERRMAAVWAECLGAPDVGVHDSFIDLGADSLKAIRLLSRMRQAGFNIKMDALYREQTIARLAASGGEPAAPQAAAPEAALTPIQRWFFWTHPTGTNQFNHTLRLSSASPLEPRTLSLALGAVYAHHDMLRARFPLRGKERIIAIDPPAGRFALVTLDLRDEPDPASRLSDELAATHRRFDLEAGELFKAVHVKSKGGDQLFLLAHHLVVDAVSWSILLEDLATAYTQAMAGGAIALPVRTDAYTAWSNALGSYARSAEVGAAHDYWQRVDQAEVAPLPINLPAGRSLRSQNATACVSISKAETAALVALATGPSRPAVPAFLLAALSRALRRWYGGSKARVFLMNHGRDAIPFVDVSRTVGWFTNTFPVLVEWVDGTARRQLREVQSTLETLPDRGSSYGVWKYPAAGRHRPSYGSGPRLDLLLNHMGDMRPSDGSPFHLDEAGTWFGEEAENGYALEITSSITGGRLHIAVGYDRFLFPGDGVSRCSSLLADELTNLIRECAAPE